MIVAGKACAQLGESTLTACRLVANLVLSLGLVVAFGCTTNRGSGIVGAPQPSPACTATNFSTVTPPAQSPDTSSAAPRELGVLLRPQYSLGVFPFLTTKTNWFDMTNVHLETPFHISSDPSFSGFPDALRPPASLDLIDTSYRISDFNPDGKK
jgi:hypothetical protein